MSKLLLWALPFFGGGFPQEATASFGKLFKFHDNSVKHPTRYGKNGYLVNYRSQFSLVFPDIL